MKVTVCQLRRGGAPSDEEWNALVNHARQERSDLVVLPEMPFSSGFTGGARYRQEAWDAAVDAHDAWESRLKELQPALVVGTRPVDFGNERYDEGFLWGVGDGFRSVHVKAQLQHERHLHEGQWFRSDADATFVPVRACGVMLGFLMGAELFAANAVEQYRDQQVDLLVTPRTAVTPQIEQWLEAARRAARIAGAYELCSASAQPGGVGVGGWVIDPQGEIIVTTTVEQPFRSASLHFGREH
jgi:N-carbamoylputrescine amidase